MRATEKALIKILDTIRMLHADDELDRMKLMLQNDEYQQDVQTAIDAFARKGLPQCGLVA